MMKSPSALLGALIAAVSASCALAGPQRTAADASASPGGGHADTAQAASALEYYPTAAQAAGIEGTATLRCGVTDRYALKACSLYRESPNDWGFGAAALALAAQSKDNAFAISPAMSANPTGFVTFIFTLHPPAILPDVLDPQHVYIAPDFLVLPDMSEIRDHVPRSARGRVVLDCVAGLDRKLNSCTIVDDSSNLPDLGKIAVAFASRFVIRPMTVQGKLQAGAHVLIPLNFEGNTE